MKELIHRSESGTGLFDCLNTRYSQLTRSVARYRSGRWGRIYSEVEWSVRSQEMNPSCLTLCQ